MAQGRKKRGSTKKSSTSQSSQIESQVAQQAGENIGVTVEVPPTSKLEVSSLANLSDQELQELLEKAKKSRVGFVILNAPFKVSPVEPVS